MTLPNPIAAIARRKGFMVLDGALATELEALGSDIADPLWSAKVLHEDPDKIRAVHLSYLDAGADCIATSGYQASIPGFVRAGFSTADATAMLERSVTLAVEARDLFRERRGIAPGSTNDPLIAGSFGPYGAFLADGSEYTGNYDASPGEIERFHRDRIGPVVDRLRVARSAADEPVLLAFETIPSLDEARILARILASFENTVAWMSFSCADERSTCEGQPIDACAEALAEFEQVVALGINCTNPRFAAPLVRRLAEATTKSIIAYPNSGETYDAREKRWRGTSVMQRPEESARAWLDAGASAVGGCCRTTPADIAALAKLR